MLYHSHYSTPPKKFLLLPRKTTPRFFTRTVRAQPLTFQAKFFRRGGVAPAPPADTTHTPRGICFKRGWQRVGYSQKCARYPWFCGSASTANQVKHCLRESGTAFELNPPPYLGFAVVLQPQTGQAKHTQTKPAQSANGSSSSLCELVLRDAA